MRATNEGLPAVSRPNRPRLMPRRARKTIDAVLENCVPACHEPERRTKHLLLTISFNRRYAIKSDRHARNYDGTRPGTAKTQRFVVEARPHHGRGLARARPQHGPICHQYLERGLPKVLNYPDSVDPRRTARLRPGRAAPRDGAETQAAEEGRGASPPAGIPAGSPPYPRSPRWKLTPPPVREL